LSGAATSGQHSFIRALAATGARVLANFLMLELMLLIPQSICARDAA